MTLKLFSRRKSSKSANGRGNEPSFVAAPFVHPARTEFKPAPFEQPETDPLLRLLQLSRLQVLLDESATWATHSGGEEAIAKAKQELEQRMALVPAGSIMLSQTLTAQPGSPEQEVEVAPFLLDVHCVTNARYQKFVDAGGYDALEFWPEEIWPHLIELRDQTGQPGPRFWRNGRHHVDLANHPVVGVSWYEAQAFALWVGMRLPTEAEWQMAASWHIKSSMDVMRRFPWGDAMDNARCNIWSSRVATTVPVDAYPTGAAPNHVFQLVGNVWEWIDTEFAIFDDEGRPIVGEMPMHVVRGGAFDTYFESQATSHFRTGQIALARAHNTGFRVALDLARATWINDG